MKNTVSKSNHGGTFKIYFYFYKGMTRLTHQEMITTAKTVCYSQSLWGGGTSCHAGPYEEAPELDRRQKEQGESMGWVDASVVVF